MAVSGSVVLKPDAEYLVFDVRIASLLFGGLERVKNRTSQLFKGSTKSLTYKMFMLINIFLDYVVKLPWN